MTTAIGSYATAADVKLRAGIGTADTNDDVLIGYICDNVNAYIEGTTGRILAPISGTPTYTYDGDGTSALFLPRTGAGEAIGGFRSIETLEIAQYTGADYSAIATGDFFLRGLPLPGAAYDWLRLSDRPVGYFGIFPCGFETVRIKGLAGWPAIPDDIAEVALTVAVRAWHARQTGQQDIVGTDEFGRPVVSRFVSGRDRDTLRRYTLPGSLA